MTEFSFALAKRRLSLKERNRAEILNRWARALSEGWTLTKPIKGATRYPCPDGGSSARHGNYCTHDGPHVFYPTNHDTRHW